MLLIKRDSVITEGAGPIFFDYTDRRPSDGDAPQEAPNSVATELFNPNLWPNYFVTVIILPGLHREIAELPLSRYNWYVSH